MKTYGLVGAKIGEGRAKLRKKEKTNRLVGGLKRWAGRANLRKKEKTNGLVAAKNRGRGRPT